MIDLQNEEKEINFAGNEFPPILANMDYCRNNGQVNYVRPCIRNKNDNFRNALKKYSTNSQITNKCENNIKSSRTQQSSTIIQQSPLCFVCKLPIINDMRNGDMLSYKNENDNNENDINVHAECFECATCGAKLGDSYTVDDKRDYVEKSHLLMDDKFYCEMHGEQRQKFLSETPSTNNLENYTKKDILQHGVTKNKQYQPSQVVFNNIDKNVGNGQMEKTISDNLIAKPIRANMVIANGVDEEFHHNTFKTRKDDLIHKQQEIVISIKESLQTSQFIKDLKKNLAGRIQPLNNNIESYEEFKKELTDGQKIIKINSKTEVLTKKSPNFIGHNDEKNLFAKRFNSGERASHLIKEIANNSSHHANISPICEHCKQYIRWVEIFSCRGEQVFAAGKNYCPNHFTCANPACNRRLLECGFSKCDEGRNYCKKCYETLIAVPCNRCDLPIISDCLSALQKQWHPQCFVCTHCRNPFGGNLSFYLENNLPYCEADWNELFTEKCANCSRPIKAVERFVEALNASYHSQCFECKECRTTLEGESFFARDGNLYCRLHRS